MTFIARCLCLCVLFISLGDRAGWGREFYTIQFIDQAKAEAHAKHLPIAWLSSYLRYLGADWANGDPGSQAKLTILALKALQGRAVVIFQDGDTDLPNIPQNMADRIETKDEGDIPGGGHYTGPKIIYTDPDLKNFIGCTLAPEIRAEGATAIDLALHRIRNDAAAQALINGTAPQPQAVAPAASGLEPVPAPPPAPLGSASSALGLISSGSFFIYVIGALAVVIVALGFAAWRTRPKQP